MPRALDRTIALLGVTLIVATALTAAVVDRGHGSSAASPKSPPGTTAVTIQGFAFSPATLHVKAGSKLTWTNRDSTPHTATSDPAGAFDTGALSDGQSRTVSLSRPGTYSYYCAFHAFMRATIVVG